MIGTIPSSRVEIFDVANGNWSTAEQSVARGYLAGASVGSKVLFAVGGSGLAIDATSAVPNSTGQPGVLQAQGSVLVSQQNLTLKASSLPPNQFGFFLVSMTKGFVQMAGRSQGTPCLSGGIGRDHMPGQILNSGARGSFELAADLSQTPTPAGLVLILANSTWVFQAWYRDQNPMPTSNFTQAVVLEFN